MKPCILNIETSSPVCSVSISRNGEIIFLIEDKTAYKHAENLHVFIQHCMEEAKVKPNELDAIAIGHGPGSYTGLRIGMSCVKGLCYALNKPLIGISSLSILAESAREKISSDMNVTLIPLIDARRMEVYTAVYGSEGFEIEKPNAKILSAESIEEWKKYENPFFFGSGLDKCKGLLVEIQGHVFLDDIYSSAAGMPRLSLEKFNCSDFENVAYCEPFYLKEFYTPSKNQKL